MVDFFLALGILGVVRDLMDQKGAGPGGLGLGSEVLFCREELGLDPAPVRTP